MSFSSEKLIVTKINFLPNALNNLRYKSSVLRNSLLIVFLSIFISRLSGSEKVTQLLVPDSEFYLTLGLFGSEITDRAPVPAYYWTRLGVIAPRYGLKILFGDYKSLIYYRDFLILVTVASVFLLFLFLFNKIFVSIIAASIITLNTTILFAYGDTYITGTVLAISFVLLSITLSIIIDANSKFNVVKFFVLGSMQAWMVMTYPNAFIFNSILLFLLFLFNYTRFKSKSNFFKGILLSFFGFLFTFSLFIFIGKSLFPELDWLSTYLHYYRVLVPANYRQSSYLNLINETSYLFIAFAIFYFFLLKNYLSSFERDYLSILVLAPILIHVFLWLLFGQGPTLEWRVFISFLWPATLIGIVIIVFKIQQFKSFTPLNRIICIVSTIFLLILSGHFSYSLGLYTVITLLIVLILISTFLAKQIKYGHKVIAPLFLLFLVVFPQLFQNLGPLLKNGSITGHPYYLAFIDSREDEDVKTNIKVQKWVLKNTIEIDRILVWVEPGTYIVPLAAMQLWGPNSVSHTHEIQDWDKNNLVASQANKLIFYGYNPSAFEKFEKSLLNSSFDLVKNKCKYFKESTRVLSPLVCIYTVSAP
jgi:hypothetical protein